MPSPSASRAPRVVAVDLTPVLPGGENGGAKLFALELVRRLARLAPETSFVVLTQAASHEELAVLDCANVRRVQVIGPATEAARAGLYAKATKALSRAPASVRRRVAYAGHALHAVLKRGGATSPIESLGAEALLCPFTAPTYRAAGVPTVCTLYDVQFRDYPEFFGAEDAALRERTFGEACRHATALAAISDYSRARAIAAGGVAPERIRTILLRLATRPPPPAALVRLFPRYLLYPANFWKHKNHEMLLAAFGMARLPDDVGLVCTGSPGDRLDWLTRATRAMGLEARVSFPGFVPADQMAALLAGATAVVFPSLYEGFGIPLVEAMAAGVPVACSNTTSLPEVAGDAALLFDPRVPAQIADAMAALVNDGALRERLVEAGRRRVPEFADADRMAREYWELLCGGP